MKFVDSDQEENIDTENLVLLSSSKTMRIKKRFPVSDSAVSREI